MQVKCTFVNVHGIYADSHTKIRRVNGTTVFNYKKVLLRQSYDLRISRGFENFPKKLPLQILETKRQCK